MADHTTTPGAHGGEEQHSHKATYFTIFFVLTFLTIVEVFVPQVYSSEWNSNTKMLLLIILAVAKASLVGLYFMHLKWEKPWLKYIALMPAYMGIFTVLLMLEAVYRGPGG